MKPNIGIADKQRQEVATELSKVLADEYVLYTKTRNAHWNVEGADFLISINFLKVSMNSSMNLLMI